MSGRLTAITFSEKTREYLQREMQDDPHALVDQTLIDILQNLECDEIPVQGTDGDCCLVIETFLPRHTTARFTLMDSETHDVMAQRCTDLAPIIESARECAPDYDEATLCINDSEHRILELHRKIEDISRSRYDDIKDLFKGLIDHDAFHQHLLDALDLATRHYSQQKEEQARDIARSWLNHINPSLNK